MAEGRPSRVELDEARDQRLEELERALAQERERVRELEAEFGHLRGQPVIYGSEARKAEKAGRQRDELVKARDAAILLLRRAADHEFKGTTAENGDAHKLVREALARIQHNPAASEGGE